MLHVIAFLLAASAAPAQPPLQPYLAGINVSDLAKATAWYTDTLGFTVVKPPADAAPGVRFAMLQSGDFRLELIELAGSQKAAEKQQGFFKVAFRVANVDALVSSLRAKGVRITHAPYDDAELGVRSFVAVDPDGNALQFFQPLRDPAAEVRDAETAFAKAFADGDAAKFASFVADDAKFMNPKRTLSGKAEVMAVWSEYMKNPQFSWHPERVTTNAAGDLGLSTGPVLDASGKHILNYISTWQKQKDGTWKVVFDGPGAPVCGN